MKKTPNKRLLFIPFGIDPRYRLRSDELAKAAASLPDTQVYYLQFDRPGEQLSFIQKIIFLLGNVFRKITITQDSFGVFRIDCPYLFLPWTSWSTWLIRLFSGYQLQRVIRQIEPTTVVNASYREFSCPRGSYKVIYDLVDDLLAENQSNWYGKDIVKFVTEQLGRADEIWTISHSLQDKLIGLGYPRVQYVPNGADTEHYKSVGVAEAAEKLRASFTFKDKFVISFIGNHGPWSGLDFLIELAQKSPASWHYLLAGGGDSLKDHLPALKKLPNVTNIGPVPPAEVATYFVASDVGILPFRKEPFTDNALPLKIIEYGAARKMVVSEPLTELVRLDFPHVIFPKERSVEAWLVALEQSQKTTWQNAWSKEIAQFSWQTIIETIEI